ncbi:peroxiredoxin [Acidisoma sp. C75]
MSDQMHEERAGSSEAAAGGWGLLNEPAPLFRARTTMGERGIADYRGRWLLFFAHPADFTPVCTSEFLSLARAHDRFQALGCDLLGLSVDSLFAHIAWLTGIESRFGVRVPFPIVEDPSMVIARAYGMLRPGAATSATVRASFIIDPAGIIRAITWYPQSVGRSVAELLRLVAALRESDARQVFLPEGWQPGDPALLPPPMVVPEAAASAGVPTGCDWYYRLEAADA